MENNKTEIRQLEERLRVKMDQVAESHEKKVKICLQEMSVSFDKKIDSLINSAFPNEDLIGHHQYHQAQIDWIRTRNDFVREVLMNISKAGTFGAIGWILYAIWKMIVMEIQR